MENHQAFIKEMQTRFEKKVKENEISLLEYWKSHLDKLLTMKPEGIASLQLQIKKITDMMENRIKILKKG
jgi:glutamate synthase domain-containing protein 3